MNFSASIISIMLLASLINAQPALAQAERFTPKQLQEDFAIAQHALEEAHSGIYRYSPKTVIDRSFANAKSELNVSTDALGFYRILQPAVVKIGCGHTTSLLPLTLQESLKKELLLPLDVKLINGRVFIFRDFAEGGLLAGREILSINGVSIESVLRTMLAAAHGDGSILTSRALRVGRLFKQSLYTLMDMRGSFSVVLRNPKSEREDTHTLLGQTLESLKQASLVQYPQDQDSKRFLEYSFVDEGKIARLKIFNFMDEDGEALLKRVFATMQENGAQTLVLDLRDNRGGIDSLGRLLFSYLIDTPFSYFDSIRVTRDKYSFGQYADRPTPEYSNSEVETRPDGKFDLRDTLIGLQQPSLPTFKGRLFILINGGSFSTTAEFLTQAHTHQRASFIGEESGGGYFGNTAGEFVILTLPNTKVRLNVPFETTYAHTQNSHAADRGVMPDYPVQRTIEDYLMGRDPELELALALARKP